MNGAGASSLRFDLEDAMRSTRARVDARLAELVVGGPARLVEAMRWAVLGGGKRLRPILCAWTHDMLEGREPAAVLDTACAFELVHTYSLVHDDLPCMDDDDLRRGRPTVHVQFDEGLAVLAGDALLNRAYEVVLEAPWASAERGIAVARVLADAASHRGLLAGQVLDLEAEGDAPDATRLEAIHSAKTGALIRAALECGGIAAGASSGDIARLRRAGRSLGLAFQIADDILDVVGGAHELGKRAGKDATAGKMTFPALYGVDESRRAARQHAEAARAEFAAWPRGGPLAALALFFVERAS